MPLYIILCCASHAPLVARACAKTPSCSYYAHALWIRISRVYARDPRIVTMVTSKHSTILQHAEHRRSTEVAFSGCHFTATERAADIWSWGVRAQYRGGVQDCKGSSPCCNVAMHHCRVAASFPPLCRHVSSMDTVWKNWQQLRGICCRPGPGLLPSGRRDSLRGNRPCVAMRRDSAFLPVC